MAGPQGEERPAALLEPLPRGKVQRHAGIGYDIVQNLDDLVLQMVEQLPSVLQFFTTDLPVITEQVIDAPKISQDRTQQRLGDCLRQPQMAGQLVDVPNVVYCSSLQQLTAEQIVDIPAPGCAGGGRGGEGRGGLQGLNRIQKRFTSSKPLTFQFRTVEVFKALAQGSAASSSHSGAADEAGQGGFSHFSLEKKSTRRQPECGSARALQLIRAELSSNACGSSGAARGCAIASDR